MKSDLKSNILQYSKFLGFTNFQYLNTYEIHFAVDIWVHGKGTGALTWGDKMDQGPISQKILETAGKNGAGFPI